MPGARWNDQGRGEFALFFLRTKDRKEVDFLGTHRKGPAIQLINLGSGSRGNCSIVRHNGSILMIDCGFSARNTGHRLAALDLDPQTVCGILVTHEHTDHVRGAKIFSRNCGAPVLATAGTITRGGLAERPHQQLQYGVRVEHHGFGVTPLRVCHDACEPCAFLVEVDGARVLFVTDLGTADDFDLAAVGALDFLYVEANHDADLLRGGPYPAFLKARIAGEQGHLDNRQSGRLIGSLAAQSPALSGVMLAHLSDKNNTAALALAVAREWAGPTTATRWVVARQEEAVSLV